MTRGEDDSVVLDAASRRALEIVLVWTTVIAALGDSTVTYISLRWFEGGEGSALVVQLIAWAGLVGGLVIRTLIVVGLVWMVWRGVTVPSLRLFGLVVVAFLNVAVIGWNLGTMV